MTRNRFGQAPGEIDSCSLALALRRRAETQERIERERAARVERRAAFWRRLRAAVALRTEG